MRIGLTYDLRADYLAAGYGEEETAEFDRPDTIEGIADSLEFLGHEPDRIGNARKLIERLGRGDRWDLVFNIAEGLSGLSRESQVPAILDVYQIPYTFSDPFVLALCLHKGFAKLAVRNAGLATPDFAMVERIEDVNRINLPFPLFAKPIAEGTGKGVDATSRVEDRSALSQVCQKLLDRFRQPVLVETFLPGREMTVGIWGSGARAEAIGALEIIFTSRAESDFYSYVNKEESEDRLECLPAWREQDDQIRRAEELAVAAFRALGCRDGGRVDIRLDARGEPNFIEVNPLAGMNPYHSDLPMICTGRGIPYATLIQRIVESAQERC